MFFLTITILCLLNTVLTENVENSNKLNESLTVTENDDDVYYPYQDWSDSFDWQLLKVFANPKYKNVIISPLSLKLSLALLYEGSTGSTEKEFQSVLKFDKDKSLVRDYFSSVLETLKPAEKKEYAFNLGTKIFLDSSMKPKQNYVTTAKTRYYTDVESLNFLDGANSSTLINSWVQDITLNNIKTLVSQDEVQNALMIIANALYFKGKWLHQFQKNLTETGGFYVTPSEIVNVPLMKLTDKFFYYNSPNLDAKILRLPYQDKKFAMFIVLPNTKGGLKNLLEKLNLDNLKRNFYYMDHVPVQVTLPKMTFNFKAEFTDILKEFGLREIFQNTASFQEMVESGNKLLFVSNLIQKAGFHLDEEGSVSYAATAVQVTNKFGEVENVFNATHPFMFFIEEQSKGTIVFSGKVDNPLNFGITSRINTNGDGENKNPEVNNNTITSKDTTPSTTTS